MVGLAVEPRSQADQTKISNALQKMEEEDPSFHVHRDEQTHVMVMEDMRELHLRLIEKNFLFAKRSTLSPTKPKFLTAKQSSARLKAATDTRNSPAVPGNSRKFICDSPRARPK